MFCSFFFFLFVHLAEDFSDNEELFAKDMTKWNSNDLMDKIETIEVDEAQGSESSTSVSCTEIDSVGKWRSSYVNSLHRD